MSNPSLSINVHNPVVYSVTPVGIDGIVTVDIGVYPVRQSLFFANNDALVDFVADILSKSECNYFVWERVPEVEEIAVPVPGEVIHTDLIQIDA